MNPLHPSEGDSPTPPAWATDAVQALVESPTYLHQVELIAGKLVARYGGWIDEDHTLSIAYGALMDAARYFVAKCPADTETEMFPRYVNRRVASAILDDHRRTHCQKRWPERGFVSIETIPEDLLAIEPGRSADYLSPLLAMLAPRDAAILRHYLNCEADAAAVTARAFGIGRRTVYDTVERSVDRIKERLRRADVNSPAELLEMVG